MTGERWERAVALFEAALLQAGDARDRFVESAAGDDRELAASVLAMLRADASGHPLLDAMSGDRPGTRPADHPSLVGQSIGPYALLREIGRGGMATVYLANDAKHRRPVALKLLHPGASSLLGAERFRREIEVVARLQHPHILPLHDSGEDQGRLYYVMPLIKGESLRERIAREGALPLPDICRITADVAGALDYAHRQGVVHRDITPGNILLDDEHAIVADFGIARLAAEDAPAQLTMSGAIIGTPAFMSPEQANGEAVLGPASDVYSLACVSFAMLAGTPPFSGVTAMALLHQHGHAPIPSVRTVRPDLSPAADEVLRRALAKAPAARYQSAREFVEALHAALRGEAGATAAPAWRAGRRWPVIAAIAAVVVLAAVALTGGWFSTGRVAEPPSIAVLPFVNLSDDRDNEYFSDGITEELTGALAQLGRIRVTPRTTAFAYKGWTGDIRQVGAELGVDRVVEGSVRREAGRLVVVASLTDATTGNRVWSDRYERDWGSMLSLQAEIAGAIAGQLQLNLLPGEQARLAGRHTVNADAYDSYLRGRYFFDLRTAASLEQAIGHFRRALEIDSLYARAHAGLADSYSILAWTGGGAPTVLFARAEQSAQRALALDSTLAEAYVSLGIINSFHRWDWAAADQATARAIALDSTLASAWFFRTWHLVAQGRMADAMVAMERARRLEPLSLITNARMATLLAWMGRYAAADSVLGRTLEIDPAYPVARVQRARTLSLQGRHAEAVATLPPDSVRLGSYESGIAGYVHARAGQREAALARARALESREYVPAEGVAVIYAGLGDRDAAFQWLDRAVAARGVGLIFLDAEPVYEGLRTDPRYPALVRRIGLGPRQP